MPHDELTTSPAPVGGRYELQHLLGRGGMGSVWRGQDLLLQRPVAVKRVELPLHLPAADRDALRQRVLREARAAARVSHARLVTIFDVVEEDGTVFLVQELVDAPTLKAVVSEGGPLPSATVAAIGRQLVDGLAAAHHNGVVHRDVKPSNVMVLPDGGVKLADFGIASLHGDPQITATGVVVGSPAYMAPEQATGGRVGPPADLWSLGATLYFAVEGEPPFGRTDTLSTLTAVVNEPHRDARIAGPLAPLLDRLLAKEPERRPDATEVVRALEALERRPAVADPPTAALGEVRPAATRIASPATVRATRVAEVGDGPAPPSAPRRRWLGAATALVLLLLVGGFALAAALGGDPDEAATDLDSTRTPETTTAAEPRGSAPSTPPTTGAPTTAATAARGALPPGWQTYEDPDSGYTVAVPGGWTRTDRSGNRTDFTDPATGTYLRVDWTDEPNGSAQADWERQSKSFGARHQAYEELSIEPTSFAGSDNASLWEYRYREGGATLHAYNLGFVVGGEDGFGFALNLQAPEEQWSAVQPVWEQLKAGFRPPPGD
ncbi:MAG TPA: serine/threonine-protein kinase [Acidimicrobiales bacterium]|nr:serine/threonine-protein kinase [Acidimicrobiales bacterium]